ncbi:MAG: YraN family protein [Planctomycetia bacterium]
MARAARHGRERLLGWRGERAACRVLRARGYRLLGRNVRTPCGEVDLLAEHAGLLVLVEVKATARAGAAPPLHALRDRQRRRLEAAGRWLCAQPALRRRGFRLDLVAVAFGKGAPVVSIRPDAL